MRRADTVQSAPAFAVLAGSREDVQRVVEGVRRLKLPFVARGLGYRPLGGVGPPRRRRPPGYVAHADGPRGPPRGPSCGPAAGVTNLEVSRAALPYGLFYAPDPSSQQVCSIGGNVAENSGGAHCLKYGFTTNHVTGLEVVSPDGEIVELGARRRMRPGPTWSASSSAPRARSGSPPRSPSA